jgi:hypothetical protein
MNVAGSYAEDRALEGDEGAEAQGGQWILKHPPDTTGRASPMTTITR